MTDALVSSLEFKRGKDAELAWLDAQIVTRDVTRDAVRSSMDVDDEEEKAKLLKGEIMLHIYLLHSCFL